MDNEKPICFWKYDEHHEAWDTGCGEMFQFMVDGPKENSFDYCPYCGCELQEVK
jgi:hypothetical protein